MTGWILFTALVCFGLGGFFGLYWGEKFTLNDLYEKTGYTKLDQIPPRFKKK